MGPVGSYTGQFGVFFLAFHEGIKALYKAMGAPFRAYKEIVSSGGVRRGHRQERSEDWVRRYLATSPTLRPRS